LHVEINFGGDTVTNENSAWHDCDPRNYVNPAVKRRRSAIISQQASILIAKSVAVVIIGDKLVLITKVSNDESAL